MTKLVKKRTAAKRAKRVTVKDCERLARRISDSADVRTGQSWAVVDDNKWESIALVRKAKSRAVAIRALRAALVVLAEGRK